MGKWDINALIPELDSRHVNVQWNQIKVDAISSWAVKRGVKQEIKDHVQGAADLKIPFLAIMSANITGYPSIGSGGLSDFSRFPNPDPNIEALKQSLSSKLYHAIVVDISETWDDYGKATDPQWISRSYEFICWKIKQEQAAGRLREVPIIVRLSLDIYKLAQANFDTWLKNYKTGSRFFTSKSGSNTITISMKDLSNHYPGDTFSFPNDNTERRNPPSRSPRGSVD